MVINLPADSVVVDCSAEGEPQPIIDWKKERINVTAKGLNERIEILSNNSLQIIAVQPVDAGNYYCEARNNLGVVLKNTTLVVQGETTPSILVSLSEGKYSRFSLL